MLKNLTFESNRGWIELSSTQLKPMTHFIQHRQWHENKHPTYHMLDYVNICLVPNGMSQRETVLIFFTQQIMGKKRIKSKKSCVQTATRPPVQIAYSKTTTWLFSYRTLRNNNVCVRLIGKPSFSNQSTFSRSTLHTKIRYKKWDRFNAGLTRSFII